MRWGALVFLGLTACATIKPAPDGFPVVQANIEGHTLSCKGTRCCWPWDNDGKLVVCIEPAGDAYFGASGVMITIRGRVP